MPRSWFRRTLALVALLCLLAGPAQAQFGHDSANSRTSPEIKQAFRPVVASPSRSTVRVRADGKDVALGTVVSADGWVVTKFDQIKDGGKLTCKLKDGRELLEVKLVGVHDKHDLALLKVDVKGLTPVQWRDSKAAVVGNWVATPGLSDDPLAIGVVSVATRTMNRGDYPPSPLAPNGGFLGVGLEPGDGGPRVNSVMKDGAADKAGIKVDDVVLLVAGVRVEDPDAMINLLRGYKVDDTVRLKIRRGEAELWLEAKLEKRPASLAMNRALFQNSMGREINRRNAGFPVALQHDTILKASDCGGPLVDLDGKAVGVNIASAGRVDSYAIPSEVVKAVLPDLMSGKLPPPKPEPKSSEKSDDGKK